MSWDHEAHAKSGHWGQTGQAKFDKTMHEWGKGKLHSSSKQGPEVKSQDQAVAIAYNQARKAGKK